MNQNTVQKFRKSVSLIVHNNFLHDSRVLKIAKSLQKFGYVVQVVALHDEGLQRQDMVDGVPVYRIEVKLRRWSIFKFLRFFRYVEFALRALFEVPESDYYHCNDIYTMPLAILYRLRSPSCKIIYDAHEFESDHTPAQSAFKTRVLQCVESFLIKFANEMITVSDSIADEYVKLYKIPKPYVVYNTPYKTKVNNSNVLRDQLNLNDHQKIFLYQGVLGVGRGIDLLIESFSQIKNSDQVLVFLGYGHYLPKVQEAAHNFENIFYVPAVSFHELPMYTSSADFGVCLIEPISKSYELCMPNKLFEYLMAGLPILVSPVRECRDLVESYRVGVAVEKMEASKIREAIDDLIKFSSERDLSSKFDEVIEKYNWSAQEKNLEKVYPKNS